jgi:hypothetical protein
MRSIIIIGWKKTKGRPDPVPINLYTGLDGVAALKAATDAAEEGGYAKIGKLTNPLVVPMPLVNQPIVFPTVIHHVGKPEKDSAPAGVRERNKKVEESATETKAKSDAEKAKADVLKSDHDFRLSLLGKTKAQLTEQAISEYKLTIAPGTKNQDIIAAIIEAKNNSPADKTKAGDETTPVETTTETK